MPLHLFYCLHGCLLVLHLIFFYILGIPEMDISLFLFGYGWNLVSLAPEIEKTINSKKYKFSFIRLCFILNSTILMLLKAQENPVKRIFYQALIPFLLAWGCLIILQIEQQSFFTFWGSILCEGVQGLVITLYLNVTKVKNLEK